MYRINELANIAGISTRTLRHYDTIGLLSPSRIETNGYRYYDLDKVNTLQQIMFYKELHYSLQEIKSILGEPSYNKINSLYKHLDLLHQKKERIEDVMELVLQTIDTIESGEEMSNEAKFKAFKKEQIKENTEKYGRELEEKYGSMFVHDANQQYLKKTKYQMKEQERLTERLNQTIIDAMATNDPTSDLAIRMCELHKEWLCFYWPRYSKNSHLSLVEMYTIDERFTKYYDSICVGSAEFLYSAMKHYITK